MRPKLEEKNYTLVCLIVGVEGWGRRGGGGGGSKIANFGEKTLGFI